MKSSMVKWQSDTDGNDTDHLFREKLTSMKPSKQIQSEREKSRKFTPKPGKSYRRVPSLAVACDRVGISDRAAE